MGKLIILAGPSCVGKSPLEKALAQFYPEIRTSMKTLILYNSRKARPGELDGVDYHFRTREQIEELRDNNRYVVMDVRGDLQALDLVELSSTLSKTNVLFEGNPFIGSLLVTHESLLQTEKLAMFMSPVSREEILFFKNAGFNINLTDLITDIMRRKLLRRTRKQKIELSLRDYENIEKRASSAYVELKKAHLFDHVIPNHDGEDSENWNAFYHPIADARKSLLAFIDLVKGRMSPFVEKWEPGLID